MGAAKSWDDAKAAAMKILGKKAKIPEMKTYDATLKEYTKADKEYYAAVEAIQDKILELQDSYSNWKNEAGMLKGRIAGWTFGLNKENPDDKKKIEEARKLLSQVPDSNIQACDKNIKDLGQLDKHSMSLAKYEAESCK